MNQPSGLGAPSGSWRVGVTAAGLAAIREPHVDLVCWRRALPPGAARQLAAWAPSAPTLDRTGEALELWGDEGWYRSLTSGLEEPVRAWLERDLRRLLRRFTEHAGPGMVRAQLAAIRGDQCRKFHCDYVRYRLLSTYVGPGTEWLPEEAVRREALEHPTACPTQANARAVRDASWVRRAAAGDVLLMKGALHPDSRGAVHRSPPIENTGVVRLVWTLSTVG